MGIYFSDSLSQVLVCQLSKPKLLKVTLAAGIWQVLLCIACAPAFQNLVLQGSLINLGGAPAFQNLVLQGSLNNWGGGGAGEGEPSTRIKQKVPRPPQIV